MYEERTTWQQHDMKENEEEIERGVMNGNEGEGEEEEKTKTERVDLYKEKTWERYKGCNRDLARR